jgi:hypothetical protein
LRRDQKGGGGVVVCGEPKFEGKGPDETAGYMTRAGWASSDELKGTFAWNGASKIHCFCPIDSPVSVFVGICRLAASNVIFRAIPATQATACQKRHTFASSF